MSMYNMLFGRNPHAKLLLSMLNLSESDCGRYRDAFISDKQIAIYTRNGGGNRKDYEDVTKKLQSHPLYVSDADDDFDSTYATYYFQVPGKYKEIVSAMPTSAGGDERWISKLAELKDMSPEDLRTRFPELTQIVESIVRQVT